MSAISPAESKIRFHNAAKERNFAIIGSYSGNKVKLLMRCPFEHDVWITPNNFKTGHGCKICAGQCQERCAAQLRSDVEKAGYTLLSVYARSHTKVGIMCDKGHKYKVTPASFNYGRRCMRCSGYCTLEAELGFRDLADKRGFIITGKYLSSRSPVALICPEGHACTSAQGNFKNYMGCHKCNIKQYEEHAVTMLAEAGIDYSREHPVGHPVKGRNFRLDFYLPLYNVGLEIDETQRKYHQDYDEARQAFIEVARGIAVLRISAPTFEILGENLLNTIKKLKPQDQPKEK